MSGVEEAQEAISKLRHQSLNLFWSFVITALCSEAYDKFIFSARLRVESANGFAQRSEWLLVRRDDAYVD